MQQPTDSEWSDIEELSAHRAVVFKRCVDAGAAACGRGDFRAALRLYEEAIDLDPTNHVLYSNRSAIYCKLSQYQAALLDAVKSYELKPSWTKALCRKGYALKCMGQYEQAFEAYAAGLAQDPKNRQLLHGLLECMQEYPEFKDRFNDAYDELKLLGLEKDPFLLVSLIGQELLKIGGGGGHVTAESAAAAVLESSLKIDTTNLRLKQAVYSALSSAYWSMGAARKALQAAEQDLAIAFTLGCTESEIRARNNLGMVHLSLNNLKESMNHYSHVLNLAIETNDQNLHIQTLSTMGQIHVRLFDHKNALHCFEQCWKFLQQRSRDLRATTSTPIRVNNTDDDLINNWVTPDYDVNSATTNGIGPDSNDLTQFFPVLSTLGDLYLSVNRLDDAHSVLVEYLTMAREHENVLEEIKALASMAGVYQRRGDIDQSRMTLAGAWKLCRSAFATNGVTGNVPNKLFGTKSNNLLLGIGPNKEVRAVEMHLCDRFSSLYILAKKYDLARKWAEKQLQLALTLTDASQESKACGNLGLVELGVGNAVNSRKLFNRQLVLAKSIDDKCLLTSAYKNLSDCATDTVESIDFATRWLKSSQETNDYQFQCIAYAKLAFLYQKLSLDHSIDHKSSVKYADTAEMHMKCHVTLAKHSPIAETPQNFAENSATILRTNNAKDSAPALELTMLRNAGKFYANFGDPVTCLKYFDRFLMLAQERNDLEAEKEACRELGLAHKALGHFPEAARYFDQELSLAKDLRDYTAMAIAYSDLGVIRLATSELNESMECQKYSLALAHICRNHVMKLNALRNMGDVLARRQKYAAAYKLYVKYAKLARTLVNGEPSLHRNHVSSDLVSPNLHIKSHEAIGYGRLGSVCDFLQKFDKALKFFNAQIKLCQEMKDGRAEFEAYEQLAAHFQLTGDLNSTLNAYERQIIVSHSTNDIRLRVKALKSIAQLYSDSKMIDQSVKYLRDAAKILHDTYCSGEICTKERYPSRLTTISHLYKQCLIDLIDHLRRNDDILECLQVYKDYSKFFMENVDNEDIVGDFSNLARLWFSVGNFERANHYILLGINISRDCSANQKSTSNFIARRFEILLDSSRYHCALGKYDEAIDIGYRCVEMCKNNDISKQELLSCANMAQIFMKKAENLSNFDPNSITFAQKSLNLAKSTNSMENLCEIYILLAMIYEKDDFKMSETYLKECVAILCGHNLLKLQMIGLKLLGRLCLLQKNESMVDCAISHLTDALNLAVKLSDFSNEIECRILIALGLWSNNELSSAKAELEICQRIVEKRQLYLDTCYWIDNDNSLRLPEIVQYLYTFLLLILRDIENLNVLINMEKLKYHWYQRLLKTTGLAMSQHFSDISSTTLESSVKNRLWNIKDTDAIVYTCILGRYLFYWIYAKEYENFGICLFPDQCGIPSNIATVDFHYSSSLLKDFSLNLIANSLKSAKIEIETLNSFNLNDFISKQLKNLHIDRLILIGSRTDGAEFFENHLIFNQLFLSGPTARRDLSPQFQNFATFFTNDLHFKEYTSNGEKWNFNVIRSSDNSRSESISIFAKSMYVFCHVKADYVHVTSNNVNEPESRDDRFNLFIPSLKDLYDKCDDGIHTKVLILSRDDGDLICDYFYDCAIDLLLAGCQNIVVIRKFLSLHDSAEFFAEFCRRMINLASDSGTNNTIESIIAQSCSGGFLKSTDFLFYGDSSAKLFDGNSALIATSRRPYRLLLKSTDDCREAMLVILHLVEKSLQRINSGATSAMFTSESSIKNKCGGPEVGGVFELMTSLGFRRCRGGSRAHSNDESSSLNHCVSSSNFDQSDAAAAATDDSMTSSVDHVTINNEPVVYFPTADYRDRLESGSAILQAFLSLPQGMYVAFSKLIESSENLFSFLLPILQGIESNLNMISTSTYDIKISRNHYSVSGIAELFAGLGLDKIHEDEHTVHMETIRVELTMKKLQNTITCLRAIFDDENDATAPKNFSTNRNAVPFSINQSDLSCCFDSDFPLDNDDSLSIPMKASSMDRSKVKKLKHQKLSKMKKSCTTTTANGENLHSSKKSDTGYASEGEILSKKKNRSRDCASFISDDDDGDWSKFNHITVCSTYSDLDIGSRDQVVNLSDRKSIVDKSTNIAPAAHEPGFKQKQPESTPPTSFRQKGHHEYARLETPVPPPSSPHVSRFKHHESNESRAGAPSIKDSSRSSPVTSQVIYKNAHATLQPCNGSYRRDLCNKSRDALSAAITAPPSDDKYDSGSDAETLRRAAHKFVLQRTNSSTAMLKRVV